MEPVPSIIIKEIKGIPYYIAMAEMKTTASIEVDRNRAQMNQYNIYLKLKDPENLTAFPLKLGSCLHSSG